MPLMAEPKQQITPETQPQNSITMKNAVMNALKKHPMSSISTSQRELGAAYETQANALFAGDPTYNISYRTDELDSSQGYREFEGSLDFPIWKNGQKNARTALATSIMSNADAEQKLLAWKVSGEVLERAWALRLAQVELEQARVQQQSAQKLEADVKRRVQAGEIARADLILAQQNTTQSRMNVQTALADVETTRAAWQAYTSYTQLPADLLKQSQMKPVANLTHPHELTSAAKIKRAQAQRDDIRKQRHANPTLSVYAKRDRGIDTDPFNNSLGVGISMPFGTSSSSAPLLAEANAAVADVLAEEAERERTHLLETRQAQLTLENARKALTLATQQQQLAVNRLKLSTRAFELGESDLFQLIRAREQADLQTRALKRSQLELHLSQARLNHILGATPL